MTAGQSPIELRPAEMADAEVVFHWRNDPFILAHGSSHREVGREEHAKWFAETILGKNRRMFIALSQENPIGQVRFERQGRSNCIVSVYLLQAFTGRGWGTQVIRRGCEEIFHAWEVDRIIACVRSDNPVGRSAFLKAGFEETGAADSCPAGHYSLIMSRDRERSGLSST